LIFAIVASSWDITLGYGKIFNFAHPVFFGVGSYTYAIIMTRFNVPALLCLALGGVFASIASILVYAPVSKVRGIYVSLITFAVSQLCTVLIISQRGITGGTSGLVGVPSVSVGTYDLESKKSFYFVALFALILSSLLLSRYIKSKYGLALVATSVYEDYARSRGVSVGQTRLKAFVISSFPAGVAGALYASYLTMASIEVISFSFATVLITMVLVGGASSIYGPIIGAISLIVLTESLSGVGLIRFVVVAVLMAATVLLAPRGIWGGLSYGSQKARIARKV
jgi:branched-chain amino acid transport system permease protein